MHGTRVIAVPTDSVLHLKSAATALPDGTVVGYRRIIGVLRLADAVGPNRGAP